jgi:hypothetical protein
MNTQKLCAASLAMLLAAGGANAASAPFLTQVGEQVIAPYPCNGAVTLITDVGDENLHTTSAIYTSSPGGGEGKQFDPKPLLTADVTLSDGQCLDAHFSALVGGLKIYKQSSPMTLFQVSLTGKGFGPRHMYGHFETPFGWQTTLAPAVAVGAEPDTDAIGANFFQHVGSGPHDVPPGRYKVNVWWAGSPGGTGATGAAFVLKLYSGK